MPTGHDMHAPVSLLAVAASLAYFPAEHSIAPEEVEEGLVVTVALVDGVVDTVDVPLVVGLDDGVGTALSGSVDEGVGDVDTVNDDLALVEDVIVGLAVADVELDDVAVDEAVDDEETVTDVVGVGELHTVSDVVVHVVETMPLPGLEPHIEQLRQEDWPGNL